MKKLNLYMFSKLIAYAITIATANYAFSDGKYTLDNKFSRPVLGCQQTKVSEDFVNFESGQVRPLALSEDGSLLFVANTPANCLEIYSTRGKKLRRVGAVQVGLEPVAVAVRNSREVWVVNHLSDSVSIVDVSRYPRVIRTLLVGDEPRDIVFAGKDNHRAFITTAHRGQNHKSFDFQDLHTPGIGRADVWVFNTATLGEDLGGSPETIMSLFADTPRALSVSPDGSTVYAAAFLSGNQTTVVHHNFVEGKKPEPNDSIDGVLAPNSDLIVKYNGEEWVDEANTVWSEHVLFDLPDKDVFEIDANAEVPVLKRSYRHVGTTLFNMAVNPVSGAVYVSNTDARNEVRFEGSGERGTTVRGNIAENRISVIKDGEVIPVHLNPHIDFSLPMGESIPVEEKAKSLSQPMNMLVSDDGEMLYLSAFGSSSIAIIDTQSLEQNRYEPDAGNHIRVPGGPTGMVLAPAMYSRSGEDKLYVYSRFDNLVSTVDLSKRKVVATTRLYNPEPEKVRKGRPFLYDAYYTSANGTASCGTCHIFGDADSLAWDLGNPDKGIEEVLLEVSTGGPARPLKSNFFHPLKGPMTTQTFRGIVDSGPMHWRGDRQGIVKPDSESQEIAAFKEFRGAFVELLGRERPIPEEDLHAFAEFALTIVSSPNPIRNLDNSLNADQAAGRDTYLNNTNLGTCNSCHTLDPSRKLFGTSKLIANEGPPILQDFKIPHFRNHYQKVGMFGTSGRDELHVGEQIRGFGYGHSGVFATNDFLLKLGSFPWESREQAQQVTDFLLAFDAEITPITGQQITIFPDSHPDTMKRIDLLVAQFEEGNCQLLASGVIRGRVYKGLLQPNGRFRARGFPSISEPKLRRLSKEARQEITYTCLPRL